MTPPEPDGPAPAGPEPDGPVHGDAPHRTALAWRRSGLSLLAAGAAMSRGVAAAGVDARPARGAVIAVLGAVLWLAAEIAGHHRGRAAATGSVRHLHLAPVALGTAALGCVALVVALAP